jgi:hypothetical protein
MENNEVEVKVNNSEISSELVHLLKNLPESLIVLPTFRIKSDQGVYDQSMVQFVKEMRLLGIESRFLDSVENRVFEVKKSFVPELVQIAFVIGQGIAGSAAWDAMKIWIGKSFPNNQKMKARYVSINDKGEYSGLDFEGTSKAFIDIVSEIRLGKIDGT